MPTNDQPEDVCELSVFPLSSRTSGEKRKRKSDSSEEEALKPYECRFCPMKFAKSQALGGHMNRHRQEREREQLLHARQLVLQQGLSWVSGQNNKQLGTRLATAPRSLPSNFQLSSSLSWNISGAEVPKLADNESSNHNMSLMPPTRAYSPQPSCDNMLSPYMVQHAASVRASFSSGDSSDMLTMPYDKSQLQVPLECSPMHLNSSFPHASEAGDEQQQQQHQLDSSSSIADRLQLAADPSSPTEFPSLQLGSGTSEVPLLHLSTEHLSPLQMAVDCECPQSHQLLSLGGYHNAGFSTDDLMSGGSAPVAAPWDGFSWIFNNGSMNSNHQKLAPSNEDHGFCLALGNQQQQQQQQLQLQEHVEHNEDTVTSSMNNAATNDQDDEEDCIAEAVAAVAVAAAAGPKDEVN